jgi:homoserine dehydrogenase
LNPVKVGLLGLGTVGGGTLNVLKRNAEEIARRAGRGIQITHAAAKSYDDSLKNSLKGIELTEDAFSVVDNPELEIIIELIGGLSPARELVLKAIENGKHVVTANKALIAHYGNEIFNEAQKQGVTVAFEAAVGGGIPIIKAVREGLAANRVQWIAGIINGTCNFILTEMREKGNDFDTVLNQAQDLGYAEADPAFDIEGTDAAHKLTILSSIAFGIPLQFERVYTEGIANIEQDDVNYAYELGYRIKHLGITRLSNEGIELRVHPALIPERRLIANVDGVMNAVLVMGDAVGPTLYYGAGAGSEPTASAVVADLVDVVRALTTDPENRVPHLAFQPHALSDLPIISMKDVLTAYYLRMRVKDEVGVMANIARILADEGISIEVIEQKEPKLGESTVPIYIMTHQVKEEKIDNAIRQIEQLSSVQGLVTRVRVESLS